MNKELSPLNQLQEKKQKECGLGFHYWDYSKDGQKRKCEKCGKEEIKSGYELVPTPPISRNNQLSQ